MNYCLQCMKPLVNGRCPDGCRPAEEVDPHILPPGTILNERYLVGRALGQGGFGITYTGRDRTLDIRVAVKEYYPSGIVTRNVTFSPEVTVTGADKRAFLFQESEKFLAEARTLAKFIGEPGIVEVRDYFRANNTAYIIMEYLDGETLRNLLQRQGPLSPARTFALLEPVMRSLEAIHHAGLIHRDISPDNIMLVKNGGVKLLDFGTARSVSPGGERSLSVMLKPGYAPEEQYRSKGSQGPWTDVYALCATMYRCITGIVPDDSLQRLYEDTVQPPSKLGVAISPEQEAALMKGMACRTQDRFQSVGALAAALGMTGFADSAQPEEPPLPKTVLIKEEEDRPDEKTPPREKEGARQAEKAPRQKEKPPSGGGDSPSRQRAEVGPVKRAIPWQAALGGAAALVIVLMLLLPGSSSDKPNATGGAQDASEDRGLVSFASDSETDDIEDISEALQAVNDTREPSSPDADTGAGDVPATEPEAGPVIDPEPEPVTAPETAPATAPGTVPVTEPEAVPVTKPETAPAAVPEAAPVMDPVVIPVPAYEPEPEPPAEPAPAASSTSRLGDSSASLNRADAALLAANSFGFALENYSGELSFTDCGALSLQQRQAIAAMTEAGILTGVSSTLFGPDSTLTKATFVMMLHRCAGSPAPDEPVDYAALGVDSGAWYAQPLAWAVQNGILSSADAAHSNETITVGEAKRWAAAVSAASFG